MESSQYTLDAKLEIPVEDPVTCLSSAVNILMPSLLTVYLDVVVSRRGVRLPDAGIR